MTLRRTRSHRTVESTALALALVLGSGGALTSSAASPNASTFVPITPCRLMDTRPGADNVGQRFTPLGPSETHATTVRGANGNCTIPAAATGVATNVAIIGPTAASFLTVFPSDQARPLAASLNWVADQAPTPNAVTVALSSDGRMSFFNLAGTVHLAVDVVGYYEPATSAPTGPQGPAGPAGATGSTGATGPTGAAGPISTRCGSSARWDLPWCRFGNTALPAADNPRAIGFDGANVWTANFSSHNVTRVDTTTGAATTFPLPAGALNPNDVLFDGTNVWTVNFGSSNLTRIVPSTGAGTNVPMPGLPGLPSEGTFDGTNLWIVTGAPSLTRVVAATGAVTHFGFPAGAANPVDVVYDGTSIWTANLDSNNLTQFDASGAGLNVPMPAGATGPSAIGFDGVYLWVGNLGTDNVSVVDPVTGLGVGANKGLAGGTDPVEAVFDGRGVWFMNAGTGTVRRFEPNSDVPLPAGANGPVDAVFDGFSVWVVNSLSDNVSRLQSVL